MSRTYADAIAHLNTLIPNLKVHALFNTPKDASSSTTTPSPDPNALAIPEMRAWLSRAALTPRLPSISYIHVAGTKGKGTVTTLIASALLRTSSHTSSSSSPGAQHQHHHHNHRIGTYTSPHLVSPRERIALDGRPISQALFARYFFELWDLLSAAPADPALGIAAGAKPFYFRYLTLLALHVFLAEGVRSAVVECGIGAEYDATNILPPASVTAAVITQLGVDHVAMLGSRPAEIAWHKAGVMKPGLAVFTRRQDAQQPDVMAVLRSRADHIGADLVEVADDDVAAWSGVPGAKIPGGDFQKRNQALAALAVTRHLQLLRAEGAAAPPPPPAAAVRRLADVSEDVIAGLREATLRGRHEVMRVGDAAWHLDGAHNADSLAEVARWMAASLMGDNTAFVLVFNQQERDAAGLLLGLLDGMRDAGVDLSAKLANVVLTRNDKTRLEGADLVVQQKCADALKEAYPSAKTTVCADLVEMKTVVDSLTASATSSGLEPKVLVTGSMYLVGNVIGFLEPDSLS